jgi:hypothetical protein
VVSLRVRDLITPLFPKLFFRFTFLHSLVSQEHLAARSAPNPLLQLRGNAGTHDLELLDETMQVGIISMHYY